MQSLSKFEAEVSNRRRFAGLNSDLIGSPVETPLPEMKLRLAIRSTWRIRVPYQSGFSSCRSQCAVHMLRDWALAKGEDGLEVG